MKKNMAILVVGIVFILIITSCSDPIAGEEEGSVTLYLGDSKNNRAVYPDLPGGAFHNSIKYRIYFDTGTSGTHGNTPTAEKTGPGPHKVQVTPGKYRLFIYAVLADGTIYAEIDANEDGDTYMVVDTRTTTTIPVTMHAKFPVFWEDTNWDTSLQAYISSDTSQVSAVKVAVELNSANWARITNAFEDSTNTSKRVELDLAYCTMPSKVFDPTTGSAGGKTKISKITLPLAATSIVDGISSNDPVFNNFTSLTDVYASSITGNVGNYTFRNVTSLISIDLSNAAAIGQEAFYGCTALETLKIPKITLIDNNALGSTGTGTLSLYLGSTPPDLGTGILNGTDKMINIRVPDGTNVNLSAGYDFTNYPLPFNGPVTAGGSSAWLIGLLGGVGWANGTPGPTNPVSNTYFCSIEYYTPL